MPTIIMMASPTPALVLLLLAASIAVSRAGVQCGQSLYLGNSSSSFRANVLTLLKALPQAAAPTGFASLSDAGAFVRGLCHADSTPSDCLANLQDAVRYFGDVCPLSQSAAAWYDKCWITYANTNASISYEVLLSEVVCDSNSMSNGSATAMFHELDSYDRTLNELMKRLVAQATNGSTMFAAGEAVYAPSDQNGTLYSAVQCMRDLSAGQCYQCLELLVPVLQTYPSCRHDEYKMAQNFNCRLRVQVHTYHDLALGKRRLQHAILLVAISVGALFVLVVVLACVRRHRRRIRAKKEQQDNAGEGMNYIRLQVLRAATSNFSISNKLGEGGFGEVFKGELQNGMEIAVKRLSSNSTQGFAELKNELVLANRLKHKNLVPLLGVCLQEKLVVYEYMPNGSLHTSLFNSEKAHQLDWTKRKTIICGIARGLLYLHEESRLKVIHRDLKPSNVLLDVEMNPKISDFGLSRAFGENQSMVTTRRPVGTLGYMSPEYAYYGQVSSKSDMYSFGVMVLEIVTGRRSNRSLEVEHDSACRYLPSYVWEKWRAGSMKEVVDPSLGGRYPESEVLNCVQIGLLCVQVNPSARPGASEVVLMLDGHSTSMTMQTPSRPAFCFPRPGILHPALSYHTRYATTSGQLPTPDSDNGVTISDLQPR
ncbi:cysteine-rich receptor-like protein kinase 10 [Hordeum vulgare subsp. vulgare]|uniref:Uncharacterized protein n=1 Tax=Hordeum vulgare subsp. vulgare TaxID=112509 RepID=A0A8I6Y8J0_HORVV|nr:cysteine-rich receptor-like protein kinase 10 [Hordeum vulgare subsp. vulgare]